MIQKIIDEVITAEDKEEREKVSGVGITGWRSSGLGTCMRGRFLNRLLSGTGIKPEIDPRTLRVFEIGNQVEDWLMRKLQKNKEYTVYGQIEMFDPELNLSGHLDAYLEKPGADMSVEGNQYIVECKSKHSKAFWYMDKKGEGAQIHHKMQLHSYLYMLNKYGGKTAPEPGKSQTMFAPRGGTLKEGCILYVSKDDMAFLEYPVRLDDVDLEKMWKFEIQTLNKCWQEQTAPPAPEKGSWQEKYCEFCKVGLCGTLTDKIVKEMFVINASAPSAPVVETKTELKVGSKVKLVGGGYIVSENNPLWGSAEFPNVLGTVIELRDEAMGVRVLWDNGSRNSYHYEGELEEVTEATVSSVPAPKFNVGDIVTVVKKDSHASAKLAGRTFVVTEIKGNYLKVTVGKRTYIYTLNDKEESVVWEDELVRGY